MGDKLNTDADLMSGLGTTEADRRTSARRNDKKRTRIVYNAHALHRVFGLSRAQLLLERSGFTTQESEAILRDKFDRRRRANRHGGPVEKD